MDGQRRRAALIIDEAVAVEGDGPQLHAFLRRLQARVDAAFGYQHP